jgi:DNA-binding transcriptional ArsR family regulator
MSQPITRIEPSPIHPDAYPVTRVSTEFHLRGIDLLTEAQGDVVDGLIVMTLVRDQMSVPRRKPAGVRALSRRLGMPYETIRRHVERLVQSGQCVPKGGSLVVPPAVLRGRRVTTFLRKIYINAVRLLADLTRIDVASFASTSRRPVKSGRLSREQTTIAVAATGLLMAGLRALRTFWGDLMKGLVYTAIWTANVKHVTNSAPAAVRAALPDNQRVPVSVLAISRSLRMPYETIRRHADALLQAGICERVGRHGLLVLTRFIEGIPDGAVITHRLVLDFLAELRRVGVKV